MPNPSLNLPPTASELDARQDRERLTDTERQGGRCPTCGQVVPPLTNRFATGTRGLVPAATLAPDDALDPDGPLGYHIHTRLRDGEAVDDICAALDVTEQQVAGIARHYNDGSAA